jgi:transglutaminase-like putative cysteine protease
MSAPAGEREPAPLLPVWLARLAGFAGLGSLGALEWQRLIAGLPAARALVWVLAALAAGGAVIAAARVEGARRRAFALAGAAAGGAVFAYIVSGAPVRLLKPAHWGDLATTLGSGTRALGTVRIPYDAINPAPRIALEVLGAELLLLAVVLALWPRPRTASRGYPFLALVALLVLVASPVVALGGTQPLMLGAVLAALCIGFLWLERLPLRPGLGVAALVGVALAGALPLAAAADRGEPWFDYRSFAEGLGPDDPVHFTWNQEYGPVDWPRDGNEVMRVKSPKPLYWKAENLEDFDGIAWRERTPGEVSETSAGEVPEDWENRPSWTSTIQVEVRRMTSHDLIAAGTTMSVHDSSRNVTHGLPGTYVVPGGLHRGDSYTATVHVPEPQPGALSAAETGTRGLQLDDLAVDIPFRRGKSMSSRSLGHEGHGRVHGAVVHFRPFDVRGAYAVFPRLDVSSFDMPRIMRRSVYWRTYQLAQRLRRGARTPFQYILRVNRYLHTGFSYDEHPPPIKRGRAPLDAFLFDTKAGYCQHFSGAMALLLRMGGIPARVATGFSPGGYSQQQKAWIVRDTDAHAWVEAWFDNIGWVTFDPTPSETPARSQIFALADSPRQPGTATDNGAATVPRGNIGARKASDFLRPDLAQDRQAGAARARRNGGGGMPWWSWALIGLAVAALAASLVAWLRRARDVRSPLERSVAELEEALRRAGRPQPVGTTLRQLEKLFGGSPDAVSYLRALSAARYGPIESPPTPAQRRRLRRALGDGLGFWGRLRAWWALPPRGR